MPQTNDPTDSALISSALSATSSPLAWGRQVLASLRRSPAGRQSTLLTETGVEHGFEGRGGQAPARRHFLRQIHSTTVRLADHQSAAEADPRAAGDGLVTITPGQTLAVRTADCLPVLLIDRNHQVAAAVHAGWRGLTAGILGEAVGIMTSQQEVARSDSIVAVIGPAIGRERYEVGPEVIDAWLDGPVGHALGGAAAFAVAKGPSDRWHFDLATAATLALSAAGLKPAAIELIETCTYGDEALWFSYRREGQGVASNWSWITL